MQKADAAFYCGTAAEIVGIASVDAYVFPQAWETTQGALLQKAYNEKVRMPASMTV
jgi:branched-chain amino acid aminotransferase